MALNSNLNWVIVPLCGIFFHLFNQFGGIIFFLEVYTRVCQELLINHNKVCLSTPGE